MENRIVLMEQLLSDLRALATINPDALCYDASRGSFISQLQTTIKFVTNTSIKEPTRNSVKPAIEAVLIEANKRGSALKDVELIDMLKPLKNIGMIYFTCIGETWYAAICKSIYVDYPGLRDLADTPEENKIFAEKIYGNYRIYRCVFPSDVMTKHYGPVHQPTVDEIIQQHKASMPDENGVVTRINHVNDVKAVSRALVNGKLHGLSEHYKDDKLLSTLLYDDGKPINRTTYHPNGNKAYECSYLDETYAEYNEDGKLIASGIDYGGIKCPRISVNTEGRFVYAFPEKKYVIQNVGNLQLLLGSVTLPEDADYPERITVATAEDRKIAERYKFRCIAS